MIISIWPNGDMYDEDDFGGVDPVSMGLSDDCFDIDLDKMMSREEVKKLIYDRFAFTDKDGIHQDEEAANVWLAFEEAYYPEE